MLELKSRFPNFTNSELFVSLCDQFENNGNISNVDNLHLKRFHHGIVHKLTSAIFSLDGMTEIIQNNRLIPSLTTTGGTAPIRKEFDDMFKLGYFQDNFFNSLVGSFDVLSMKINLILNSPIVNLHTCYFGKLTNTIFNVNPAGTIESYLNGILNSAWYQDTTPYRNCLTHRNLLDYVIKIEVVNNVPMIKHYLPDDPLSPTYTFNNEIECLPFCRDKLNHFIDAINNVDGLLINETNHVGRIPY